MECFVVSYVTLHSLKIKKETSTRCNSLIRDYNDKGTTFLKRRVQPKNFGGLLYPNIDGYESYA